jgi:hypothetical protein
MSRRLPLYVTCPACSVIMRRHPDRLYHCPAPHGCGAWWRPAIVAASSDSAVALVPHEKSTGVPTNVEESS